VRIFERVNYWLFDDLLSVRVKHIFVKLQISKLKLKNQFIIFSDHLQITIKIFKATARLKNVIPTVTKTTRLL